MPKPTHSQAEAIYKQILEQLEELWMIGTDTSDSDAEEDESAEPGTELDVVDAMVEEGTERGMDEEALEKVLKAVYAFSQKSQED